MQKPSLIGCFALSLSVAGAVRAQSVATAQASDDPAGAASSSSDDLAWRRDPPVVAYAYAAHGAAAKTLGVHAYGLGIVAPGQGGTFGGGGAIWGSPIDRLTLIVDGKRNLSRE